MSGHRLTSGRLLTYAFALIFTSTAASAAIQTLNSINDLKRVDFGDSVPKHSLLLLHWFANIIQMDYNDVIRLNFEPNERDYGAHYYGNSEWIVDPAPRGYRYYTVGNLNPELSSSVRLPSYITRSPYNLMGYEQTPTNRDRIIVRVRENDRTIDQVYITQHDGQGPSYDREHTYRITPNLLREIRWFSTTAVGHQRRSLWEIRDHFGSNISDYQMRGLENMWGDLARVGLLLFIVITERQRARFQHSMAYAPQSSRVPDSMHSQWSVPQARQNDDVFWMFVILIVIVIVFIFLGGQPKKY